jgi:predicted nucleotidyltransferase
MSGLSLSEALPNPVEGDLLELRDGSIWVVKGCWHGYGGLVALPRVVLGRKLKRFSEAYEVTLRYYRHFIRYVDIIGREVPIVPHHEVSRVLRWGVEGVRLQHPLVCSILEELWGAGLKCGIAGSYLGGYYSRLSDIDVHCLDLPGSYGRLRGLYESGVLERMSSDKLWKEVYEVSEAVDLAKHVQLMSYKLLQGVYRGVRLTIRFVNCDRIRPLLGPYIDVRPAELLLEVRVSDYRTPTVVEAEVVRSSTTRVPSTLYLVSHRLRFAEIPEGTLLYIEGPVRLAPSGLHVVNIDESSIRWLLPPGCGG